ncbi:MAG: diguanylate cyclase (GGDEF)-like protein/PAS domain S-box-containing protein [Sulfurimonas sp.]|jgi:diguanylate cyclase (GGDEF)-like protein/PAS domain S-box-containing protein
MNINFMILAQELNSLLLTDKDIVIIDVRPMEDYRDAHITTAVNIPEIFTYLPHGLTTKNEKKDFVKFFENVFSKAGVSSNTMVVFYEDRFTLKSPRGLTILEYLGHNVNNIKVLDGGLERWCKNSFETSKEVTLNKQSKFTVNVNENLFVDYDEMLKIIYDENIITLDVRDKDEWEGISSSPYGMDFAPKKGRLPNAIWIEWYKFITSDMLSIESLYKINLELEKKNIKTNDNIVLYCFKGARLSNTYIALKKLGYQNIRIYFAGWNEWCRKEDAPIINEAQSSNDPILRENILLKKKLDKITLKQNNLIDFPKYNEEPIFAFNRDGNIDFENSPKKTKLPNIKKFTDIFKDATSTDINNMIDNTQKKEITIAEGKKYYNLNCIGSRDSNHILVYSYDSTELNTVNNLLNNTINSLENLMFVKDSEFRYLECNGAFERFIGCPKDELIGKNDYDFFEKELADSFRAKDAEMFLNEQRVENLEWTTFSDGSEVYLYTIVSPMRNDSGKVIGLVGNSVDLTTQKKLENELTEQHEYLQAIIDGVDDSIMVIKEDYTVELMNESVKKSLSGIKIADLQNPKCYEVSHHLSSPCDGLNHPCPLRDVLKTKKHTSVVHTHGTKNEKNRYIELSASPLFNKENNCIGIIESARDITEHLAIQDELRKQKNILHHQAYHDGLTGLPNRILLYDRLEQAIQRAKRDKTKIALLFIDLDNFKDINDSLGHDVGDVILKTVSSRLEDTIRNEDTVARLGGDEFTVILEGLSQAQDSSLIAQKIIESLNEPVSIVEHVLHTSSSIGISIYPDDGILSTDLLKFADSAMYKAKDAGKNNFKYYNFI